jgi:hypothetical protein
VWCAQPLGGLRGTLTLGPMSHKARETVLAGRLWRPERPTYAPGERTCALGAARYTPESCPDPLQIAHDKQLTVDIQHAQVSGRIEREQGTAGLKGAQSGGERNGGGRGYHIAHVDVARVGYAQLTYRRDDDPAGALGRLQVGRPAGGDLS